MTSMALEEASLLLCHDKRKKDRNEKDKKSSDNEDK